MGYSVSDECNFLLEGDNLHLLKLLEKTHKGKIDVIYIDPPYNTGGKDFIYNDTYIGKEDGSTYSDGLPANLKYYKTDFVAKDSEEIYDDLLEHIEEMIQLQYGIKIDKQKYVIIMDDDEMDEFERNFAQYDKLQALFINQDVLLSSSQEKLLNNLNTYTIPDCYFDFELREAGELW